MKDKTIYAENRSTIQKKKSFFEKVKEYKTEIIIAGVTIISIAGAVLTAKNRNSFRGHNVTNLLKEGGKLNNDSIPHVSEAIENAVSSIPSNGRFIDVKKHIRNLPKGWKVSSEKLDSAINAGIILGAHQTWVDDYSKLCA
ncbi:hypothetical protein [Neobacillus sp. NPDC093127]|uniref:hypothetical protein n=1 Tax=Neobacillus sp. NPDC093127 TaxID=3364296 RepID=UPI0038269D8A